MSTVANAQIAKSIAMTTLGALPGIIWYVNAPSTQPVVIGCLGAFVGFALSLPGVSAARVAGGTVAAIAAHNAPRSMRNGIWDFVLDENEQDATPDDIVSRIIQHANEHGRETLPQDAKHIALIVAAEAAADSGSIDSFIADLSNDEFECLRDGYSRMNAIQLVHAMDNYSSSKDTTMLRDLILDRVGYDYASICTLVNNTQG